ncbi:unnamed protein product [Rhizoctonia solani]|uniref:Uncharacterized protein n=1 Tax=Rhizoctonia solani TaxID=456999 RepID=A0A8H3DBS2_9AGAM|nr:unnamed protein product [Rhizoctonia solani]
MSTSPSPQRPEGFASRLKFRNPTRALTMSARPASPSTTGPGSRPTPSRSSTRDSSTPPPISRRSSMIPAAFQRRASAAAAPSSTKASSKAPSSEAVNELGAKTTEPSTTTEQAATEQAPTEAPKEDTSADVSGHARALSGSTVDTEPPMTPPPTQTAEPMSIPKSDDPMSDSPHDGASISSSRSPSRLRRRASNLSRHSVSGSLRRLSLLGPASPPQAETAPVHAQGEMQKSLSKSPSLSSLRRHATSPEPDAIKAAEATSTPEPASEVEEPQPAPQPTSEPAPVPAPEPASEPEVTQPAVPQTEALPTVIEAPKSESQPEVQPAVVSTPKEATPAPSVKAPSSAEASAPKPVEPKTPVKPLMSRSASRSSLTRSPTPDRPEPKRRGTLANWARKSLDRRPSLSGSPAPSSSALARPASRGPVDDDSDTDSVKERERKWGTGLPVPNPPTPKKSEDGLKRRFSLGRRQSESTKSPNESSSEAEKKPNWGSKMLRAVTKTKKEKEKGDGSSITPEQSSLDVATETVESPPSLVIPDRSYDQRPLSAIVESPAVPLNPYTLAGPAQSPEQVLAAPIPAVSMDSPVVVQAETTSPEMSPVMVNLNSDTSGIDSGVENLQALTAVAPEVQSAVVEEPEPVVEEPEPVVEAPEPVVEEPEPVTEVEHPKDDTPAPVEEIQETPVVVEEVAAPEAGTSTPPVGEAAVTSAPPENLLSPMSPNSPASSPWDPATEREIARARSPRQSNGGPSTSTSNRRGSPAPSIIGVKRKHPDEPTEVGKSRVRYLPDWAVSPAIQLAVTLSIVLPRRKRDVANPSNRKRSGWWPLRRGTRTDISRTNAIRGVNEEMTVASKSWVVPAAVRTTAKVVTAPARRGDIEWGPVDETDDEDTEDEPRRFEFSSSPSPEPDFGTPPIT